MVKMLIFFSVFGSVFLNLSLLMDSKILPKWVCFAIGCTLIIFVFGLHFLRTSIPEVKNNKAIITHVITWIVVGQAIYGLVCYHCYWNQDVVFDIGSFENPAGFASCLCAGFPFCLLSLRSKNGWRKIISVILVLLVLVAIYVSKSRAGYVSCVIMFSCSFLFVPNKLSRHLHLVLNLGAIIVFGCAVFFSSMPQSKQDSMNGRKLIWTVGMEMIKDKPILGHGMGSIERCYMDYQAGYLKHSTNQHEMLLADNVKHVFNDYLAIAIQFGVVGILLLSVYIALLFFAFFKIAYHDCYAQIGMLSLISLGSFAIFSYPSCYPFTWIIMIVDSIFVFSPWMSGNIKFSAKVRMSLGVIMSVLAMIGLFQICMRIKAEITWKNLYDMRAKFDSCKILNGYQEIYPQLYSEPYFLYNYAVELSVDRQYSKALQIAEECRKYWADYDLELLMAYNYMKMAKYDSAIFHFRLAEAMCPNRFEPLYQLMCIYQTNGDKNNSRKLAYQILCKPIKVYSSKIRYIKKEAKFLIDGNYECTVPSPRWHLAN